MSNQESLYDLLKSTFLLLDDGDRQLLARFNLSVARYYALYHLGRTPGISITELSDHMLCDKSNITRIVKGLERDGYVTRQPHETDGRSLRLFLTAAGEALRHDACNAHEAYNQARFETVGLGQQEDLIWGLNRLNKRLRDQLDSANSG